MNPPDASNYQVIRAGYLRFSIPQRTARLLFVSDEDPDDSHRGLGLRMAFTVDISDDLSEVSVSMDQLPPTEPSTIFTALPVKRPTQPDTVQRPPYYPTYVGMTAEQRWTYLDWLSHITQEVNIGFVFVYYYGLERHLVCGGLAPAFDEVLLLRRHHDHSSFVRYSTSALTASCGHRGWPDRLSDIPPENHFGLTCNDLESFCRMKRNLAADDVLLMLGRIPEINKRYIRNEPDLYGVTMAEILTELYEVPLFPLGDRYDLRDVPTRQDIQFANLSLPEAIRYADIPDFYRHRPFVQAVQNAIAVTHELVRAKLAELRKRKRRNQRATGV